MPQYLGGADHLDELPYVFGAPFLTDDMIDLVKGESLSPCLSYK